jgi:alkanesulfonate monooxygenase SsuD/methylene tetrahydromethanopterin reductase-like flavin-dependent oxidoreductase (luciferase family)
MKFAHMSHIWRKPGMPVSERYAQLWRELEACDATGFDYGFCVEHHATPIESLSPSPAMYVASAAARTTSLRVGAMGWHVPLANPLRMVEEVVALDHLTQGRLEVGLVSGALPRDFSAYQKDFDSRRARALEGYQVLKAACANPEGFSFEGPYHKYHDVALITPPLQQPLPPVWFETRHPPTLEYLAQEGVHTGYVHYLPRAEMAVLYREYIRAWKAAGHPTSPHVNYWTLVYVDESDDKAWEVAGPSWVQTYTEVAPISGLIQSRLRRKETTEVLEHFTDPAYLREHGIGLIGSPDTVAGLLRDFAVEGSFDTLLGEFNFGFLPEENLLRSIRLFGQEVIPKLRDFHPY